MGIFASRYIKKDEELTFNYNVDRYGYAASYTCRVSVLTGPSLQT
jgi:SET domain-containing protein